MTPFKFFTLLALALTLGACDGGYHEHVHDAYHDGGQPLDDAPALLSFDVIDSYGSNSAFDLGAELALSPYIDDGNFEIDWSVDTLSSYHIRFYLNDVDSIDNAILVASNTCGFGYACGNHSYQQCHYTEDFQMGCSRPESSSWQGYRDIGPLVAEVPQTAFLVVEACDSSDFYCEFATHQIQLE